MRTIRSFAFLAVVFSFGAVGFGASTAQAAICCSAAVCQGDTPPSFCNWCTPTCADDETPAAGEIVYDEVESLCYVAGDLDPVASVDAEASGCM